jgi:hypothetical protein
MAIVKPPRGEQIELFMRNGERLTTLFWDMDDHWLATTDGVRVLYKNKTLVAGFSMKVRHNKVNLREVPNPEPRKP